ncbi:hypothetical protein WR25_16620 [Diploscapter pachys]|uniref:Uncharacterized protein n=1 Tax=Diploscapter pachys TaxID=2018661 RepID=A0A2A2L5H4_9BILA|nr:hypothetical protein WR25_16620 [Diploscapter pachys]
MSKQKSLLSKRGKGGVGSSGLTEEERKKQCYFHSNYRSLFAVQIESILLGGRLGRERTSGQRMEGQPQAKQTGGRKEQKRLMAIRFSTSVDGHRSG